MVLDKKRKVDKDSFLPFTPGRCQVQDEEGLEVGTTPGSHIVSLFVLQILFHLCTYVGLPGHMPTYGANKHIIHEKHLGLPKVEVS